jgi:hypothetical protein
MTKRQSNRPDRRLAPASAYAPNVLAALANSVSYGGSGNHKLHPGDYGFTPPVSPRPSKSVCDDRRPVLKAEAGRLFRLGILCGMVSPFALGSIPKYVWAVAPDGEVFEAKTKPGQETLYHGYRLGDDDSEMRGLIRREWKARCQNR